MAILNICQKMALALLVSKLELEAALVNFHRYFSVQGQPKHYKVGKAHCR